MLPKQCPLEWKEWVKDIDNNIAKNVKYTNNIDLELHKKSILKFGNQVVDYMNSADWHKHWSEFVDYTNTLDDHLKTDILDVYPEFTNYFTKVNV